VRFPDQVSSHTLATRIYQRTDGNPLFLVNIADMLVRKEGLGQEREAEAQEESLISLPENVQRLIEREVDKLAEVEQRVLEAASVAGAEFSVAAAAAGLEQSIESTEETCETLAKRGQFLRVEGLAEWPDGTVCTRYRFIHALYQEVLYKRIAPGRRIRLHRRIGERIEAAYGGRTAQIATELAVHFDHGHEPQRAVRYYQHAGENALRRHGYQEAIRHLRRGLELLRTLSQTRERVQREIACHLSLGAPLLATKGNGAPEVEANYLQARALCEQIGETEQLFPILGVLMTVHCLRGELTRARTLAEQYLSLAQQTNDPAVLLEVCMILGSILLWRGDLNGGRTYLEQGLTLYDRQHHHAHALVYGQDPGVVCHANMSYVLWLLGYPDQAFEKCRQAYALAQEVSHPYSLGYALDWAAMLHQLCLDGQGVQTWSEAATVLAEKHGFAHLLGVVRVLSGWALVEQGNRQEGIAVMQAGLVAAQNRQAILMQPYAYALLAEAFGKMGQLEEGERRVAEGLDLVEKTGERWWEAEL
jgi:predicted ATPase